MTPKNITKPLFSDVFQEVYIKKPVPWNRLNIFLTHMLAECWYSCLFHNRGWLVHLHWFFLFKRFSQYAFSFWQIRVIIICSSWTICSIKRISCKRFHWYEYELPFTRLHTFIFWWTPSLPPKCKRSNWITPYFKLIKTTGLIYSSNESSFRMLFR